MITQDEIKQLFTYREDGFLIRNRTGKAVVCSPSKNHRYLRISIKGKAYYLHRIIFLLVNGYFPCGVDHIDGDRFNNKIENLRDANQSQNCLNRTVHKNNKTGHKNIHWQKNMSKWCVKITINQKSTIVGYFEDIELADLVASEYRAKYHGEFARS